MNALSLRCLLIAALLFPFYASAQEVVPGKVKGKARVKTSPAYPSYELISKAWDAYNEKDYIRAIALANQCVKDYTVIAREQQTGLREIPVSEMANDYWALNDVGTCLYIKGKALDSLGRKAESDKAFQDILGRFPYAQCWDNSGGWFWKIADAARKLLYKNKEL